MRDDGKMVDSRYTLRTEIKGAIAALAISGFVSVAILIFAVSTPVKLMATGAAVLQYGAAIVLLLWHPSRVRMDSQRVQWRDATSLQLHSLAFEDVRDVVWQDSFSVCVGTDQGERLIPLTGLDTRGRETLMERLNERQLKVNIG